MAGFTDDIFRSLCEEQGALFTVSEMISARAVSLGDKKSDTLAENYSKLSPYGIQLFGTRPEDFAVAAERLLRFNPDFYDINCGCPAPKITGPGGGSSLLKTPDVIYEIVKAVKSVCDIPVSVKLRTGIDGENKAVSAALAAEKAGAGLITVHGRYQKQGYRPPVDYIIAAEVKAAVSVPVLYNGDVHDRESMLKARAQSGADGVMIGRASLGNPFVFKEINDGESVSQTDKIEMLLRHAKLVEERFGFNGIRGFRTHLTHYIKGFRNATTVRRQAVNVCSYDDIEKVVRMMGNTQE